MTSRQGVYSSLTGKILENIFIAAVISFTLGIFIARSLSLDTLVLLSAALLSALAALAAHLKEKQRPGRRWSGWLLLLFFFLAGIIHVTPYLKPPVDPLHIYNHVPGQLQASISGILLKSPLTTSSDHEIKTRLLVRLDSLILPPAKQPAAPAVSTRVTGLVLLTVNGVPPPALLPGDHFMAKVDLFLPQPSTTPGTFNYRDFLAYQSVWVTGLVREQGHIITMENLPGARRFSYRLLAKQLLYGPERIRHRIGLFLDRVLEQQTSSLYKAILIGDKQGIPPHISEKFKAAGGMHILAISGMHMGLLALILTFSLQWLFKRSSRLILTIPVLKTAALLSIFPLTGYALVAGFNPPVVRALIMTGVFITAILCDRHKSLGINIALAALLIMVWRPASLYTVSFQLSFAAVIAIAAMHSRLTGLFADDPAVGPRPMDFFKGIKRWLLAGLLISTAALLGTSPLLVYHFNRISLLSPLTTLILEPLICFWSLLIGLAASAFIPLSPEIAEFLFHLGGWGLKAAVQVCAHLAALPGSFLVFTTPSAVEIIFYFIFLAVLFSPKKRLSYPALILAAVLLVSWPVIIKIKRAQATETTVTFLDVGQGSATLMELPRGETILVDGGGPSSERFNVGERIIAPYLWQKRLDSLDSVIITHAHADHYNGLFYILRHFRPKTLWFNGQEPLTKNFQDLLGLAKALNIELKIAQSGAVLSSAEGAQISCVANPFQEDRLNRGSTHSAARHPDGGLNSTSLVLKLSTAGHAILLPGDIGRDIEEKLIQEEKGIGADILLSPHHGSATSNSREFIAGVSPQYLVISAGRRHTSGYPVRNLNSRSRDEGIKVLNTALDGSISYTIDQAGSLTMKLHKKTGGRKIPATGFL